MMSRISEGAAADRVTRAVVYRVRSAEPADRSARRRARLECAGADQVERGVRDPLAGLGNEKLYCDDATVGKRDSFSA